MRENCSCAVGVHFEKTGGHMLSVADLKIEESVLFEPNRLADLYRRLGEIGAENVLCDAMEELTIQLVRIEKLARRGRIDDVRDIAEKIGPVSGRIGLKGLERVAANVAECARNGDNAGFGATVARLSRIGDKSLTAIWDPQDLSV